MKDLTEDQMLSEKRNNGESFEQYKARRGVKNLARSLYLKNTLSNARASVYMYMVLIFQEGKIDYDSLANK